MTAGLHGKTSGEVVGVPERIPARENRRAESALAGPVRALVIAPQPFFSPRGTPLSVYYRTLVTAEQGATIDLLTYGEGQDVSIPGVRIIRGPRFPWLGNVKIGPSPLKLFLDFFLVLQALGLLTARRYDIVHAHEEAIFFCWPLKRLFKFKLIYDMHSSLPQQLTNFGFTKSKLLIAMFEALERRSLRAADAVITICPDLAEYALSVLDDPDKHFLIENSIFEDVRLSATPSNARDETMGAADILASLPTGRDLVVYAGTLEPYQGIDLLIRGFAAARKSAPGAFLLIAGGNPTQTEKYRTLTDELGLTEHCRFTGRLPQADARRLTAAAAVQVSPRVRGTNTPLKVYEQLASGVPLVATDIYSHRQVLNHQVSFLTAPEPEAFAQGMVEALTDETARGERIAAARQLYDQKYSREVYVGRMRRLLKRLM